MRIAIVGAGMAGLACAHELERLGYTPDIFERKDYAGKPYRAIEVMAQFMHDKPHEDVLEHLRGELNLSIEPACRIAHVQVHGPGHDTTIRGDRLGYVTVRGPVAESLDSQLLRRIQAPVHYHQERDVPDLARAYDWVVVATGDPQWTKRYGLWRCSTSWWIRGALVEGHFTPGELHFFLDTRYAGTGHALLMAADERTAITGIGLTESSDAELERLWTMFRAEQGHRWDREISPYRQENIDAGMLTSHVVDNVLFAGAAGGFLDPLGMNGQCPSLTSGVMAARQIVLGDHALDRYARRWAVYYNHLLRLKRYVNSWSNKEMGRFVRLLDIGVGRLSMNAPFNLIKPAAVLLDALRLPDDPSANIGPN